MKASSRGDLRHVLKLQGFDLTTDDSGGYVVAWQSLNDCPSVYAAIYDINGYQGREAAEYKAVLRHKIILPYRTDVKAGMRLVGYGRTYEIEAVLAVGSKNEYLEVQARSE